jgi:hypothetical protein
MRTLLILQNKQFYFKLFWSDVHQMRMSPIYASYKTILCLSLPEQSFRPAFLINDVKTNTQVACP